MASTSEEKSPIAEPLRVAIESSGRTLNYLAEQSGVDRASLGRFVSGERLLRLDVADRVATALGLSLVRTSTPPPPKALGAASSEVTTPLNAFVQRWNKMHPRFTLREQDRCAGRVTVIRLFGDDLHVAYQRGRSASAREIPGPKLRITIECNSPTRDWSEVQRRVESWRERLGREAASPIRGSQCSYFLIGEVAVDEPPSDMAHYARFASSQIADALDRLRGQDEVQLPPELWKRTS